MMNRFNNLFLSLLSAALLSFAWPVAGFSMLIFVALVPLFLMEQAISSEHSPKGAIRIFAYSYLTFFLWNCLTTWWIINASAGGAAMAILANALLQAIVFVIYHKVKQKINSVFVFIPLWLAFEYFHLNWDLSWPWLNLGNVFSSAYKWVQWYEYTGTLGGSLWVLLVNVLLSNYLTKLQANKQNKGLLTQLYVAISVVFLPLILSWYIYNQPIASDEKSAQEVVIVQPNIDPYNEKFNGMSDEQQLLKLLQLAGDKVDSTTDYLIAPETAIAGNVWEDRIDSTPQIKLLSKYLHQYPKLTLVIGASTAKVYRTGEELSPTARKFTQENAYYDSYNTALQLQNKQAIQIYHKSKLVPGVEKIPFPAVFKHFESLAIDLGGTTGSLGIQNERTVFTNQSAMGIAPVICYESIYGEFVAEFIRNGAQLIYIITNDGWWGDTPGYRQHLTFASLRAIETRRYIARSANTGTSAVINPKGDIAEATPYWEEAVIKTTIFPSQELTFYVKYGDYLGIAAAIAATLILALSIYTSIRKI